MSRAPQILNLWSRIHGGGPFTVMKKGKQEGRLQKEGGILREIYN